MQELNTPLFCPLLLNKYANHQKDAIFKQLILHKVDFQGLKIDSQKPKINSQSSYPRFKLPKIDSYSPHLDSQTHEIDFQRPKIDN